MTTFAAVLRDDECRLTLEPLHASDPGGPVELPESGIRIAGTAVLEAPDAIAAALGLAPGTGALMILGAAYLKWGRRFSERIGGEYAVALWDPRARLFVCARDGLGIRRLYVGEGSGAIVASNSLAAVLAHPSIDPTLDARTVAAFLSNGSVRDLARTFYEHVRLVPPGHTLVVHAGRAHSELFRHWRPPAPAGRHDDLPGQYRAALTAAVRERAGSGTTSILLSGGIDSTTVAAAAVDAGVRLRAVTCAYTQIDAHEEVACAHATAARLGIPIEEVPADAAPPLEGAWSGAPLPQPVDEPALADWRALVHAAARHSTVILHGEDGDSLLCAPGLRAMLAAGSSMAIARATAMFVARHGRLPYLGIRLRERLGLAARRSVPPPPAWLTAEARHGIERAAPATVLGHAPIPLEPHAARPETFRRLANVASALAPTIAPETTGAAAELRYPLLDSRVMQVVLAAPAIPWLQSKQLPRTAFANRLPGRVITRPKTPLAGAYEAAVAAWRARSSAWEPAAELGRWADRRKVMDALERGTTGDVVAAWRAVLLSAWLDQRVATGGRSCTR